MESGRENVGSSFWMSKSADEPFDAAAEEDDYYQVDEHYER